MTLQEFSNEFDSLIGSYISSAAFGKSLLSTPLVFDEYEKSVFLTLAQEEIVKSLYSGKNEFRDSFEKNEETRSALKKLIRTYTASVKESGQGITEYSIFYRIPDDVWYITFESVVFESEGLGCKPDAHVGVIPVEQDYLLKVLKNPFKGPSLTRVLRLDEHNDVVELVSKYDLKSYTIRYLIKPSPIILLDLDTPLSIDGIKVKTECKLGSVLHRAILENAVRKALASKGALQNKD